ncbi:MAG: glutamate--cysteine ligase [Spirochaetales bacterium]|nr:glutamate--cysteine ligase [Spirochaetales bacterium]MCP5483915.1 glutamate--cysteine ligase [Spirochaetales bacterium]
MIVSQLIRVLKEEDARLLVAGSKHGLERECLRINEQGQLSERPHPAGLGSSLTHPYITTDFSESQLEYTTAPHRTFTGALRELEQLQAYTCRKLEGELLWPLSMPARLPPEDQIPIAHYGTSEAGMKRTIYRRGLAHRYGRRMQTISGVHYNVSFGQSLWKFLHALDYKKNGSPSALRRFVSERYFAIARNFMRHAYVLPYLFGSSPVVDRSFVGKKTHRRLRSLGSETLYARHATSLRLSDVGYTNVRQRQIQISYDGLEPYLTTMREALTTPEPDYSRWSASRGEQLNDCQLQIENEHYGVIRPKQIPRSGERPITALEKHGVLYLEVRALDLDPFVATGIGPDRLAFVQMLLAHCLLSESPALTAREVREIKARQRRVVWSGRSPRLKLPAGGSMLPFRDLARALCEELEPVAGLLDSATRSTLFSECLENERSIINDANLTPSARILTELKDRNLDYTEYGLEKARRYREFFCGSAIPPSFERKLDLATRRSIQKQRSLEGAAV